MSAMELLNWSRGPALQAALLIFLFGMLLRLLEIILLGRDKDYAKPRGSAMGGGVHTLFARSIPARGTWPHHLSGYIWHVGYLIVLLFFAPHILLFQYFFGFHWSAMANSVIDIVTIVTLAALCFTLFSRISDPVRRLLSNAEDYFTWLLTFLPVATGYMAMHRIGSDYTLMLAIHISSVNLLLVVFPFTKLTHAMTLFLSRWYTGANAGRKGLKI